MGCRRRRWNSQGVVMDPAFAQNSDSLRSSSRYSASFARGLAAAVKRIYLNWREHLRCRANRPYEGEVAVVLFHPQQAAETGRARQIGEEARPGTDGLQPLILEHRSKGPARVT